MTPAADMTVDYPHGTTAGYKRGCRGSGECPGAYGQTCAQANVRAASDWQYAKAVGKDREVEYLAREHAAAEAPAKSAKVKRAESQQRKQVREAPVDRHGPPTPPAEDMVREGRQAAMLERREANRSGFDRGPVPDLGLRLQPGVAADPSAPDIDVRLRTDVERGVNADGSPYHAPEPPLPIEPVLGNPTTYPEARCPRPEAHVPHEWTRGLGAYVSEKRDSWCPGRLLPAGFEVFDRGAEQTRAAREAALHRTRDSRKASAQKSADAQRERALATASAEHPLGLKLDGTPRVRPAKGTVLTELGLRATGDYPTTETVEERAEATGTTGTTGTTEWKRPAPEGAASVPPDAVLTAPPAPVPAVPGATVEDLAAAAVAAERVAAVLAETDWKKVAANLGRIADALEKIRGLA